MSSNTSATPAEVIIPSVEGAHLSPLNIPILVITSCDCAAGVPPKLIWHRLVMDHGLRIPAPVPGERAAGSAVQTVPGDASGLLPSIRHWLLRGHEVQSAPKIALLTLGCNGKT